MQNKMHDQLNLKNKDKDIIFADKNTLQYIL